MTEEQANRFQTILDRIRDYGYSPPAAPGGEFHRIALTYACGEGRG